MNCPKCGSEIGQDYKYCEKCGYRLDGEEKETVWLKELKKRQGNNGGVKITTATKKKQIEMQTEDPDKVSIR